MSEAQNPASRSPDSKPDLKTPAAPPRRRRRWLRWLLGGVGLLVVLLGALVALAPTLASQPAVRDYLLGIANQSMRGKLALDGLSLSWTGPQELRNLTLTSADQKLIHVERLRIEKGLLGLTSFDLGTIELDSPHLLLSLDAQNRVSLADAFSPAETQAPALEAETAADAAGGALPDVRGRVVVKSGTVSVSRAGGAKLEVTALDCDLEARSLSDIQGRLSAAVAGSTLEGQVAWQRLFDQGRLNLAKSDGKLALKTTGPIDVAALADVFAGELGLGGAVQLSLDATASAGDVKADLSVSARGLRGRAAAQVQPLDVDLTSHASLAGDKFVAQAKLASQAGELSADLESSASAALPALTADRVLAAVLRGESLSLPEFKLRSQGGVDLAKLNEAVPGLLNIDPQRPIVGGRVDIRTLSLAGGAQPSASVEIEVRELRTASAAAPLAPLTIKADSALVAGSGLEIRSATLGAEFAQLTARGAMRDLTVDWRADLAKLSDGLAPLVDLGAAPLRGTLEGNARLTRPDASNYAVELASRLAPTANESLEAKLSARYDEAAKRVAGNTQMTGSPGVASADFDFSLARPAPNLTLEQVLAAVLAGEKLNLPEFTLNASANLDLARLDQLLPGALQLGADRRITAGKLEVSKLSAAGGDAPSLNGSFGVKDVSVALGEQIVRPAPIATDVDARLADGVGLEIKQAELRSTFATLSARGKPADLSVDVEADLTRLKSELAAFVDLSAVELAGAVVGNVRMTRPDANRYELTAGLDGRDVRVASGATRLELPAASIKHAGAIGLADDRPVRVEARETIVDLAGEAQLAASGWYDLKTAGFAADVKLAKADLAFLGKRAGGIGGAELARYAGVVSGDLKAGRDSAQQPIATTGTLTGKSLTLDGKPLSDRDTQLAWAGVQIAPDLARVQADSIKLDSAAATLTAAKVNWAAGADLNLALQLDGSADLARLVDTIARAARMAQPPALAGTLKLASSASTANDAVQLRGQTSIQGLVIGSGAQAVRQDQVQLDFDSKLERSADRLAIQKANLRSGLLTLNLNGAVEKFSGEQRLALKGDYEAQWPPLMALAHELAPATRDIAVEGVSKSTLSATGPVNQPGRKPAFRGLETGIDLGFSGATVYGIKLGAATLKPRVKGGKLDLPLAEIPAAGGKLRVGGQVDFAPAEPTFSLQPKTTLVEKVPVNKAVSQALLSYVNPIFMGLSEISGQASLSTQDVLVPLGDSMKTRGAGNGVLDLKGVKMKPGGLTQELLALSPLGKQEVYAVEVKGCAFELKDGRIRYDDFTLIFPEKFDLKFRGSVGLDSTLELFVSVPVSAPLLERFGVTGPALQFVKDLEGARVDVPITGTREQPKLDLAKVDMKPIVDKLLKKQLEGGVGDVLKGLGGGGKDKPASPGLPIPLPKPKPKKP